MDIVYMFREMIFHVLAITFHTKTGFWNYEMTTCYNAMFIYFVFSFTKRSYYRKSQCFKINEHHENDITLSYISIVGILRSVVCTIDSTQYLKERESPCTYYF